MKIKKGQGKSFHGTGIEIKLSKSDISKALHLYLYSKGVLIEGARTTRIDDNFNISIHVDPSGSVLKDDVIISGKTGEKVKEEENCSNCKFCLPVSPYDNFMCQNEGSKHFEKYINLKDGCEMFKKYYD